MVEATGQDGPAGTLGVSSTAIQFVAIEVFPTSDGLLGVSMCATALDETTFEFVNEDLGSVRGASLDDALSAIRDGLTGALFPQSPSRVQ